MLLDHLEYLIIESYLQDLQHELNKNAKNPELNDLFENGENLYHRLVKTPSLDEDTKCLVAFKLSDAGIDINIQTKHEKQTCLHLAVMYALPQLVYCLLQNGADLTITDQDGLCAYNHAKRLNDREASKKIIQSMQSFYPTYWVGIDNSDIDCVRRLINSWCKFRINRRGVSLIDYAVSKRFKPAFDLFKSLESQMDLCFAVMACNVEKVESIVTNNSQQLRVNFKNMKEKGATIFYYAIKHNNFELLKVLLDHKPNILNEYIRDESDIDYPLYFMALASKIDLECLKIITPQVQDGHLDISQVFYRGKSFLRYSIEVDVDIDILEYLLGVNFCSRELITVKDPEWLTCREFALKQGKTEYADLIDRITAKYVLESKDMRQQLALNGFDFKARELFYEGKNLLSYAKENNLDQVVEFLEIVDEYQQKIEDFHDKVDKNDYYGVKGSYKIDPTQNGCEKFLGVFNLTLLFSNKKENYQSIFHRCVLNGYFQILELVLELITEDPNTSSPKLDSIRDHCYRTPFHYASGIENNKRTIQLLSQFGFSDNVYDKDGQTPLDFQERAVSEELQEVIRINKQQLFKSEAEPNPWTWKVWTRIQSEKDTLKQLISYSNPWVALNIARGHSHGPPNFHTHSHFGSHSHHHSHNNRECEDDDEIEPNVGPCVVL